MQNVITLAGLVDYDKSQNGDVRTDEPIDSNLVYIAASRGWIQRI